MYIEIASFALPLFSPDVLFPILTDWVVTLLWIAVGLMVYAYLTNLAVFEGKGRVCSDRFDLWDALLASTLVGLFLFLLFLAAQNGQAGDDYGGNPNRVPDDAETVRGMISGATVFFLIIVGILAAMQVRNISWRESFGLTRLNVPAIGGTALLLIAMALPLVSVASYISQSLFTSSGSSEEAQQELVKFFIHSNSEGAKWVVAISAAIIAPIQEEFLFRGYIYGVARRYGGVIFGLLVNATIFALIHNHVPSLVPLFVLAACLTLAYEWTGCLWVNITMHAIFNLITVVTLMSGKEG